MCVCVCVCVCVARAGIFPYVIPSSADSAVLLEFYHSKYKESIAKSNFGHAHRKHFQSVHVLMRFVENMLHFIKEIFNLYISGLSFDETIALV